MGGAILKSERDLEAMRAAGQVVAGALHELSERISPGVSTFDLDCWAFDFLRRRGASPSFKGYRGFPATICASVNEEVVHGIPSRRRVLQEGDIIGIDVGARLRGFHADAAVTVAVGRVSEEARRLLEVTRAALWQGLEQARPGRRLHEISGAIQRHVESHGFTIVREMVGHGIGRAMHEEPQVPNYISPEHDDPLLREGMTFAVEPMVNLGAAEIEVLPDNWTVRTRDGRLSAHFEHTVAVTRDGPRILTLREEGDSIGTR
jgi:methionyl aminopeptidase